jgi:hypothetical protein
MGVESAEYRAWVSMNTRCHNPRCRNYAYYGGRGITVFPAWRSVNAGGSFLAFFAHIGPRPSRKHSVDRINNDGNYEPGNVRWATPIEQRANRPHRRVPA